MKFVEFELRAIRICDSGNMKTVFDDEIVFIVKCPEI